MRRVAILGVLLAGCTPALPPSPRTGYETRMVPLRGGERTVLLPLACADPSAPPMVADATLPGCVTARNAVAMAEDPQDLVRGRPLGDPPAGPIARAADLYLEQGTPPLAAPQGGAVPIVPQGAAAPVAPQ
jgi:hypothetical protein